MAVTKRTPPTEERAPEPVSAPLPQPTTEADLQKSREARLEQSEESLKKLEGALKVAGENLVKVAPPPTPEPPVKATYRVWPHGTLQHNGKTYAPGTVLVMRIEDASKVPCLEKVDG